MGKITDMLDELNPARDADGSPVTQRAYDELCADKRRLDWLADPTNDVGLVELPVEWVGQQPGSLRDAIDAAMAHDRSR